MHCFQSLFWSCMWHDYGNHLSNKEKTIFDLATRYHKISNDNMEYIPWKVWSSKTLLENYRRNYIFAKICG